MNVRVTSIIFDSFTLLSFLSFFLGREFYTTVSRSLV